MKQVGVMIICIIIVAVSGICEIKYLNKSSIYLMSDIEYIKNAINNNNYDLASEQSKATYDSWGNIKKIWNIFINHEEIDDIENSMIDLKEYIEFENKEECLVAIEKIKSELDHTIKRQQMRIDNIL